MSDRNSSMSSSALPTSQSKEKELWNACEEGRVDDVRRLVGEGADVNWSNNDDWLNRTCLIIAGVNGHTDVVRVLFEAEADLDKTDSHGHTPLIFAACYEKDKVVDLLLDAGADISKVKFYNKTKAIHWATKSLSIMISLICAGADVEAEDENGERPLHYACRFGNVDAVSYLIDAGVDVDAVDKKGHGARWHATEGARGDVNDATKARIVAILGGVAAAQ